MRPAASSSKMTYSDYLAAEATSDIKHEYLRGEVFVMAGGRPEHAALAVRTSAALIAGLRGKPCNVYSSDLRLRVEETDLATYPDVTVVCGGLKQSPIDKNAVINPTVLVEVLSDSTEAWDRGEKASHYRRIPSLREYLLIAQDEPRLELYRRTESGVWELHEARTKEALKLDSIGVTLEVDDIYFDAFAVQPE